jgi:tripartite-type tricarboxylate transporter receptor subunit TctC
MTVAFAVEAHGHLPRPARISRRSGGFDMPQTIDRRHVIGTGLAAGASLALPRQASAQAWPSRPIKFVVTFPPGGLTDLFARAYGEFISQKTGQAVLVENKSGAGGIIGAQAVKSAAPDGYTLMFTISTTMIMNRLLYKALPYDPDKDFVLISSMNSGGLFFMAHKSLGVTKLADVFEHSKKNKVIYGTYSAGSESHMAITELNRHFGTNIDAVHYRGAGPSWLDFNASVIHAASGTYPTIKSVIDAGTGVPLALWSDKRSRALPDVPTFSELGLKGRIWDLKGFVCLVGPAGMPPEAVDLMSNLMVEAGKGERIAKLLDTYGIEEGAVGKDAFRKLYDAEKPVWLELVSSLGVTAQ